MEYRIAIRQGHGVRGIIQASGTTAVKPSLSPWELVAHATAMKLNVVCYLMGASTPVLWSSKRILKSVFLTENAEPSPDRERRPGALRFLCTRPGNGHHKNATDMANMTANDKVDLNGAEKRNFRSLNSRQITSFRIDPTLVLDRDDGSPSNSKGSPRTDPLIAGRGLSEND